MGDSLCQLYPKRGIKCVQLIFKLKSILVNNNNTHPVTTSLGVLKTGAPECRSERARITTHNLGFRCVGKYQEMNQIK
jgi:hypothetical protein